MPDTSYDWQPIETAPRDGSQIAIGWYERGKWCEVINCRFMANRNAPAFTDDRYHGVYNCYGERECSEKNEYRGATHWRVQVAPPPYAPVSDAAVERLAKHEFEYKQIGCPEWERMPWENLNTGSQNYQREQAREKLDGPFYVPGRHYKDEKWFGLKLAERKTA